MSLDTIIFLHGNSCDSTIFENQMNDKNLQIYNLISLDLPGHGKRNNHNQNEPYSISSYAKDIKEKVQQEIDKGQRVLLVGHSMGGHVFINFAGKVDIAGLVTFGAPPMATVSDMSIAYNPLPEISTLVEGNASKDAVETLFNKSITTTRLSIDKLTRTFLNTKKSCREDLKITLATHEWNEIEKYKMLKCPYILINSTSDPFINQVYMDKFKDKSVEINGTGHYPHIEGPIEFNSKLLDFIKTL